MNRRLHSRMLADGRRLHLHDGPIDLIVEAFGAADQLNVAYHAASARFATVLAELCGELQFLRRAADNAETTLSGVVAKRMYAAVKPYAARMFITPMAAVAGAVAEEILLSMTNASDLQRAYVNNGGDIAINLAEGEEFAVGMAQLPSPLRDRADPDTAAISFESANVFAKATIRYEDSARGIATSGWRGRSFSLGIADSVTVLARTASMADAAATVIANAVDLPGHPAIGRVKACDLAPDTDLGERLVTHSVGELLQSEIHCALAAGSSVAESLRASGLICAAALSLQGQVRVMDENSFIRPSGLHAQARMVAHG